MAQVCIHSAVRLAAALTEVAGRFSYEGRVVETALQLVNLVRGGQVVLSAHAQHALSEEDLDTLSQALISLQPINERGVALFLEDGGAPCRKGLVRVPGARTALSTHVAILTFSVFLALDEAISLFEARHKHLLQRVASPLELTNVRP